VAELISLRAKLKKNVISDFFSEKSLLAYWLMQQGNWFFIPTGKIIKYANRQRIKGCSLR